VAPLLHLLELSGISIYQQLQWEEALLRADTGNWCILNQGSPLSVVMGISGRKDLLINEIKWKQFPIPIIRRFSGGGTVIVDENTIFVTFIFQSNAIPIQPFPKHLMEWSIQFYRPLFEKVKVEVHENDYVIGNRKWGGNAQSITRGRWLHHSSILWDYSDEAMEYLLQPPKMPSYRKQRSHCEFLCRLRNYWEGPENFQDKLKRELHKFFQVSSKSVLDLEDIVKFPYRKSTFIE